MSRRRVIEYVAILAMLITSLLASACGAAAPTPTKVTEATKAAATAVPAAATATGVSQPTQISPATPTTVAKQPKMGGTFTYIQGGDYVGGMLDAHYMTAAAGQDFDQVYQSLLGRDRDTFAITPALAERYEVSADGKTVTLYLRKGVKWHNIAPVNGREFVSSDVKWNLERIRDMKPPVTFTANLTSIQDIQTPDAYTVKILLKEPYAPLMFYLSNNRMFMYPKELVDTYGDKQAVKAIGTGPFMLKSYEPKVAVNLVRNPDYYEKGLPRLDELKIVFVADASARLAAIRSGQADGMDMVPPTDAEALKKAVAGLQTYQHTSSQIGLRTNPQKKPLDDVRVRRAIMLAVDRQQLIALAADNAGAVAGIFRPDAGAFYRQPSEWLKLPGYRQPKDQDIAEAKRLLAEAGYANGLTIEFATITGYPMFLTTAEVLVQQLARVGITVKIRMAEATVLQDAMTKTGDFEVLVYPVGVGGDPDGVTANLASGAANNLVGYGSKEIDDLLVRGRAESDEKKRIEIYKTIEDKNYEQAWMIPLYSNDQFMVVRPGVSEMRPVYNQNNGWFGQSFKYVWLDK